MLHTLRNLGLGSARMLRAAGIESEQQLHQLGAVAAYMQVKRSGQSPSINLLWALEGALSGRDWREVARQERTALLMQLDAAMQSEQSVQSE